MDNSSPHKSRRKFLYEMGHAVLSFPFIFADTNCSDEQSKKR